MAENQNLQAQDGYIITDDILFEPTQDFKRYSDGLARVVKASNPKVPQSPAFSAGVLEIGQDALRGSFSACSGADRR